MGTSTSQRSPRTISWAAVDTVYKTPTESESRLMEMIWRAADNQLTGKLSEDLESPLIGMHYDLARKHTSPVEAIQEASEVVSSSGEATLAVGIASRALTRSYFSPIERGKAFLNALFEEASSYLVSRDLPSFLGTNPRLNKISDLSKLKSDLTHSVKQRILTMEEPKSGEQEQWRGYVRDVINTLQGDK